MGNTLAKAALFEGDRLIHYRGAIEWEAILQLTQDYQPSFVMLASVASPEVLSDWAEALKHYSQVFVLTAKIPLPFSNHYETPHSLGADRLAGVAGAEKLYPGQACLVIDIGTSITYDYMDEARQYWGGAISPGMHMRFKALHRFTARLPLLEPLSSEPPDLLGRNTQSAMLSGVINGISLELEGMIAAYRAKFGNFAVIVTGGDAVFFETKIKEKIFVIPKLILIGINRILEYNVASGFKNHKE
ncbi:MAG: type III pantothenate kinase [Bacteroidia bacterium]|nr:type III pantothenate kinase [Bacteroidia bacterium]